MMIDFASPTNVSLLVDFFLQDYEAIEIFDLTKKTKTWKVQQIIPQLGGQKP